MLPLRDSKRHCIYYFPVLKQSVAFFYLQFHLHISDDDRIFNAISDVLHNAVYDSSINKASVEKALSSIGAASEYKLHFHSENSNIARVVVYCEGKKRNEDSDKTEKEKLTIIAIPKNRFTITIPVAMEIKKICVAISDSTNILPEFSSIIIDFIHQRKRQTYTSKLTYHSGYGMPNIKLKKAVNYNRLSADKPIIVTIPNDDPDLPVYTDTKRLNTQHISAMSLYRKYGNNFSYRNAVNDKGWPDYQLSMMAIKCISELCIKMDILKGTCFGPDGTYIWCQYNKKNPYRYYSVTCRNNQAEYNELTIDELDEMVTFSPKKQDAYIVIPKGMEDTPFIIERTDITPTFAYETDINGELIPFFSKAKEGALEIYPGFIDFSFCYQNNDLFYAVAPILATYQREIAKYPHFYKVTTDNNLKIDDSMLSPDDLMGFLKRATLNVSGYATLPYPFKYLREWEKYFSSKEK